MPTDSAAGPTSSELQAAPELAAGRIASTATHLQAVRDFEMAMSRLGRTMMTVGDSWNKFHRRLARRSRLAPVAVKPALRGRRRNW